MSMLTNIASKNAKYKNFRQEFGLGILVTIGVRFLTASISIFAGYFYFANLMSSLNSENKYIPIILAVLVLVVIEFFSAWLLGKLTKASLQTKWVRAFVLLVFAVGTFTASFISSTNGLAMRQSNKADNTNEIVSLFNTEKQNIKARYDILISELKQQITDEKNNPAGWKNNKRFYLTAIQLKRISSINQSIKEQRNLQQMEISEIKEKKNIEVKKNRQVMTATANKYYKFIAIILIISALSNIALQVFYRKIFKEEKAQLSAISDIDIVKQDLMDSLWNIARREASNMRGLITEHLAIQNSVNTENDIIKAVKKNSSGNTKKILGFSDEENNNKSIENKGVNKDLNKNKDIYARTHVQSKFGQAICPNCKSNFTKNSYNHKYCSEICRIEYAEKKTGKNLNRYKKLHT